MCKVVLNENLKGIELYFEGKPSQDIREKMKENGFRWNWKKSCWYAKQSEKTLKLGNELSGSAQVCKVAPAVKKINSIDLYELMTFTPFEVEKNYNVKEITKQIRTHLKKRFSFIKMSIRNPYGDRVSIEIKEAPFKENSAYMVALKKYIEEYVNAYNFCTSYDPYGDYGSSYNLYFFGTDTCGMIETKPTEAMIEAMKKFDIKAQEVAEAEERQREKEYQENLIKWAEEEKKAKEREEQEKNNKEYIVNNVEIIDMKEEDQYYIKNAQFANLNKNNTLAEYKEEVEKGKYYNNTLKVTRELHFKDLKSYDLFSNMLLHDFDFIDGTGGSYTEDLRINSMTDYYNMAEEEKKTVEWILQGIAVYLDNELMFVIDAQGYCYARYVGLIGEDTETTKEFIYNQVVSVEEIEERKIDAGEIIKVYNEVMEKNSFNDWYNTRKLIADTIKENVLLNFSKETIQQIKDEKIKSDLYKVLKEVDKIQDQFKESGLKQGDKLTIVRGSMIGGASISYITLEDYTIEEYVQHKDNIKMTMSIKNKRGLYSTNIHDNDVIIYRNWIDIPVSILYEDTSNGQLTGTATKYGSYDKQALEDIISYLQEKNILPVINTYKPVF